MRNVTVPQNYPFKTNFAGMRGDLLSMQTAGWELSVDCDRMMEYDAVKIRVAGRHRSLGLLLISGHLSLPTELWMRGVENGLMRHLEHMEIPIKVCAQAVTIPLYGTPQFNAVNFGEFGMRELKVDRIRQFSLEDLCVFKTFGKETELFVPEKKIIDVQEYLKDILVSQEDKQKEIRQRMLREGERFNLKNELQEAPKLRLVGY